MPFRVINYKRSGVNFERGHAQGRDERWILIVLDLFFSESSLPPGSFLLANVTL